MSFLDRLERRFGDWAITQFALFIVVANGVIYLISQARPEFIDQLILDPAAVRHGEFWRLFTFLFIPPQMSFIWMAFWLLVLYQFALALENEWGNFRFCIFYAVGALAMILAAFFIVGDTLSNVPMNTTLFLAFATLFPDFQLYLFFILPVKVKYLAALTWLWLAVSFVLGSWVTRVTIAASLVNYAVFFGPDLWQKAQLKWEVYKNRKRFRGE